MTLPSPPVTDPPPAPRPDAAAGPLPVNDLARSYQPRRVWAAEVSIAWNLALAAAFVFGGFAERLYKAMAPEDLPPLSWIAPAYLSVTFAGYALLNFPLDLWFGYLEERQFGLAKDGVRAWARDWLNGTIQHGVMFGIGAGLILIFQLLAPDAWVALTAALLLALFLATTYLAADLIPLGLFHLQRADDATVARLGKMIRISDGATKARSDEGKDEEAAVPRDPSPSPLRRSVAPSLPPTVIYSHSSLREFAGGIVGLGNRQVLLLSRATIELASDRLLRFVLLHDLGHRRYQHNLLSALAGWAWVVLGICASQLVIPTYFGNRGGWWTPVHGTPLYTAFLAVTLSVWMALGEPVLAYLGRRLEYQADRFYLRHGGTADDLRAALHELATQNLARTESMGRRETIFHPLPSIANRIHAARRFERQNGAE
jgi:Zn-dependent protease with chaperone function